MSVVTEFFVAPESDLGTIFAGWKWGTGSIPPPSVEPPLPVVELPDLSKLPRIILRGISPTELVTLRASLDSNEASDDQAILRPMILAPPVPGRMQWVHQVPRDLVAALAALDDAGADAVGTRWAEAERKRIETLADEAVRLSRLSHFRVRLWQDMLGELIPLATTATATDAGLYLFMHM